MTSMSALNTALTGMRAARTAMDTAGHNVANAHTDGYTRQRVDLAPNPSVQGPNGPVGTGVHVADIARLRDSFLDERVRSTGAAAGAASSHASVLERAEAVTGEPDDGLTEALAAVWDSFDDLANDPAELAQRQQVLGAVDAVARKFQSISAGFDQLRGDTHHRLTERVAQVNDRSAELAAINADIAKAGGARPPADLLDRRDQLVDELSQAVGARVAATDDGSFRVTVSGLSLVEGTRTNALRVDGDEVVHASGHPVSPSGEIGGLQQALQTSLPALADDVDGIARTFAGALNTQHGQGFDLDGQPGGALLSYDPVAPAASLALAFQEPREVAAAAEADRPHDPRNAQALAELRTRAVDDDGLTDGDGASVDERLRGLLGELASAVSSARATADGQTTLHQAADEARRGEHGVSTDEEMVSLIAHQRAFEAAARVTTAVDQALDTLINRTGVVGR